MTNDEAVTYIRQNYGDDPANAVDRVFSQSILAGFGCALRRSIEREAADRITSTTGDPVATYYWL